MVGRPTDYSPEIAAAICSRMSDGESLRKICADEAMPDKSTVFRWLPLHEEFRDQYARASEDRAHAMAEEALEIADDGRNDIYTTEDGKEIVNHDHIARSRLRVDTRKWFASKLAPKKYGDKVQQEVSGPEGGPIPIQRIERVIVDSKD